MSNPSGRRSSIAAAVILLGLAGAGCAPDKPASPADALMKDPAAMKRAKLLYTGTCAGYCHNNESSGPRDAPNLLDCTWLHGGSDQEIFNSISHGWEGTRMIGFGGKLPEGDKDIWGLVGYLKSQRHCS